jgi:hypothetical protein
MIGTDVSSRCQQKDKSNDVGLTGGSGGVGVNPIRAVRVAHTVGRPSDDGWAEVFGNGHRQAAGRHSVVMARAIDCASGGRCDSQSGPDEGVPAARVPDRLPICKCVLATAAAPKSVHPQIATRRRRSSRNSSRRCSWAAAAATSL